MKTFNTLKYIIILYFSFFKFYVCYSQSLNPSSISTNGTVSAIVQDSARIYFGGLFSKAGYKASGIAKLDSNGRTLFNFPSINNSNIYNACPDGNGGWYLGGNLTYKSLRNLIHILSDNSIDTTFAPNPDNEVYALYLDGGILYIGGWFTQIAGQSRNHLASINVSSGNLQLWNPDVDGLVTSIIKDGNYLYVGGGFLNVGGKPQKGLTKIDITTVQSTQFMSCRNTGNVEFIDQDADNIYVGGSFVGAGYFTGNVALLNSTNDLPDFNFPLIEGGSIICSISDGLGGWYIGGNFTYQGNAFCVAHILSNNSIDLGFNAILNSDVVTLSLNGNTLYIGGYFSQVNGQSQSYLTAVDATTGALLAWNPSADGPINTILAEGSNVYVGGSFSNIGGSARNNIAAINSASALALSWNPNANGQINRIESSGTNLIVAGNFNSIGGQSRNYLASIDMTSGLADSWNPDPNNLVSSFAFNGTSIFVGGDFTNIGGQTRNYIAEIDLLTGLATGWNPDANASIKAIQIIGTSIYAAGAFTNIGGLNRQFIASLDAVNSNATPWNPQSNSTVNTLTVYGNSIFAGGGFEYLKSEDRNNLFSISKSSGLITSWNPNPNGGSFSFSINGATAYVGGAFSNIGGQPRNYIAEINLMNGLATAWDPNANGAVHSVKLIGNKVFASGDFTNIGGQDRNYIAELSQANALASPFNPKPDAPIIKIFQDNNNLVVVGVFSFMNTELRNSLFSISKSNGQITEWDPNTTSNSPVILTLLSVDNSIYAGGSFTDLGGQPRNNIACLDKITGNATTWDPVCDNIIFSLAYKNNILYVGGEFSNIGGQSRSNLAALNTFNNNATSWAPNPDADVRALEITDSILYVGGSFSIISGVNRNRLCSYTLTNDSITNWNPDVSGFIYTIHSTTSNVYIGGSFNLVSGMARNNIACFSKSDGIVKNWSPDLGGGSGVFSITTWANQVFVGGLIYLVDNIPCNNFIIINANSALPYLFFPNFNSGTVSTILSNDSLLYIGGNISQIDECFIGGLTSYTYPLNYFTPKVDYFTPVKGGNNGSVVLNIFGNGFKSGTQVRLTKNGSSDILIPDSLLQIDDNIKIKFILDLFNVDIGLWNIVVTIPNDTVITSPSKFEVEAGQNPDLFVNIIGPSALRTNQWQYYHITITNSGNTVALAVPLFIVISANKVEADYNFGNIVHIQSDSLGYDTIPPYLIGDSLFAFDLVDSFYVFPMVIASINPNETNSYSIKLKPGLRNFIDIYAWAGRSFLAEDSSIFARSLNSSNCHEDFKKANCIVNGTYSILGLIPGAGCISSSLNGLYKALIGGLCGDPVNEQVISQLETITDVMINCAPTGIINSLEKATKLMWEITKAGYDGSQVGIAYNDCISAFRNPNNTQSQFKSLIVTGIDPNEKYGPTGIGSLNYINNNHQLPYEIHFENVDTATASAQTVVVIDTLDPNVYDLSTFHLNLINIGNKTINLPLGLKNYQTDIDLRPTNNIIVHMEADLNLSTGVAKWIFTSLDPGTLNPTTDPFAGFLPPNLNQPEGEGAVLFTIKTWDTLTYNTQVKNKAYIYFDFLSAVSTNEYVNTVDNVKPQSHVEALPPIIYNDSTIRLSWYGNDLGSGIKNFTIYYSIDGNPYQVLFSNISDTSALFIGSIGSNYSFYSIASDSVGNIEDAPINYDAITSLLIGVEELQFNSAIITSLYPNPNSGNFTIEIIKDGKEEGIQLFIEDILGKEVFQNNIIVKNGINKFVISAERLSQGLYVINIKLNNYVFRRKFIKN